MKPSIDEKTRAEDKASETRQGLKVQELKELGEITLVELSGRSDPNFAIWKSMMEESHYLHTAKLIGEQIKYLIKSSVYGWIGGLCFSSASWKIELRDERLGLIEEERAEKLKKIICNSRFLILPEYGVKNLASYVLSLSLKRLSVDWESKYKIQAELVESFVDSERFSGACYKASNWILLGQTKGRGRNDRYHKNEVSKKYIFVYELRKGVLGPAIEREEPEEEERDWVDEEYEDVQFSNQAKKKRAKTLIRDFFSKPASPIPLICEGAAKLKGAYRFFSDKKVLPQDILAPHIKQTIERAKDHEVVLSVNDTTSFNLSSHSSTSGLGCLSSGEGELGYLLHDTILFTTEGVPLGVLDAQTWSREVSEHGKRKERRKKPIEEKESYKWIKSLEAMSKVRKEAPEVMFVNVGDREADIYELFETSKILGEKFVVRSSQNRRTTECQKVWDLVENTNVSGKMKVIVKDKDKKSREAELEIRFMEVTIPSPKDIKAKSEITIWAISAKEISSSDKVESLHWKLFTNIEVTEFAQSCEKVKWYSKRFGVETYHRILKSGRRSEDKRLGSLDRLERCLSIDMIAAWRLMYLTMSGRKTPEVPSDFFFNKDEIEVLKILKYGSDYETSDPMPLNESINMIAVLGGFVKGKGRVPGVEIMWRGIRRLEDIVLGATLTKRAESEIKLMNYNSDYG